MLIGIAGFSFYKFNIFGYQNSKSKCFHILIMLNYQRLKFKICYHVLGNVVWKKPTSFHVTKL